MDLDLVLPAPKEPFWCTSHPLRMSSPKRLNDFSVADEAVGTDSPPTSSFDDVVQHSPVPRESLIPRMQAVS